jgi:hypothetical protein
MSRGNFFGSNGTDQRPPVVYSVRDYRDTFVDTSQPGTSGAG